MSNISIQMIAVLAWLSFSISYYVNKKQYFIILQLLAYFLYSLHYNFLGGFTGALSNICGVIVLFLLLYKEFKKSKCYFILIIIILMYIGSLLITYDGLPSLIPMFACIVPLISNWQDNFYVIKIGAILGTVLWILYAIIYGSYATIITDVIFIITTSYSIYLQRKKELK